VAAIPITRFHSKTAKWPVSERPTWAELRELLTTHDIRQGKDGPLWSPAEYAPDKPRGVSNVLRVHAIVLDMDDGVTPDEFSNEWAGIEHVIHSTYSHTLATPKWRAVFPLAEPVSAADWSDTYRALSVRLGHGHADSACKDAARIFYLPSCPKETAEAAFAFAKEGAWLDPAPFLPEPAPAARPTSKPQGALLNSAAPERVPELVRRALAGEHNQGPGRNNGGLWLAVQLRDNGISESEAETILLRDYVPHVGPTDTQGKPAPYTSAEARATLKSVYARPPREPWAQPAVKIDLSYELANGAAPASVTPAAEGTAPAGDDAEPVIQSRNDLAALLVHKLENDTGNGERFAIRHGSSARYSVGRGWFVWDRKRWRADDAAAAQRAKLTAQRIFDEVELLSGEEEENDKAAKARVAARAKWAVTSGSGTRLREMLWCAQSEPGIAVKERDLDRDPFLLTCLNGTLDLHTGTLRPHRREDLLTRLCPVAYDPEARSDVWESFLDTATGGDTELTAFLARAAGYTLTGSTREEVLFFVHGPAAAGKSTFVEALKAALGELATTASFDAFLQRRDTGGPRSDIAKLAGARLVASIEVDEGKRLAEGLVKTLTGGDTVSAAFKFKDEFEFVPAFKLWLVANHAPRVRDDDSAIWRRILRLPFENALPMARRDPRVKETLKDPELSGPAILAWAVRGCLDWQANGLRIPAAVERSTNAYRTEMDPLLEFFEDCCERGEHLWTQTTDLKRAYDHWARERKRRAFSPKDFAARLALHGCTEQRKKAGGRSIRGWAGVALLSDGVDPGLLSDAENGGWEAP
jgi:putative DNA primase/helicase